MKTLKIFISSTFKDMNAERDVLIKSVFPKLRERAEEELGVRVQEIDLRWGVTEEQVKRGEVVELCLDGIEEAKPYFICMIGKRYGWIPAPTHVRKGEFEKIIGPDSALAADEKELLKRVYVAEDLIYKLDINQPVEVKERVQRILEKAGLPEAEMSATALEVNHVLSEYV